MKSTYLRRQIFVGAGALMTTGMAFAAEPRRTRTDFSRSHLEDLVPFAAGRWTGLQDPDVVPESVDGSVDQGQTVTRRYYGGNVAPVMLVISYHGPQSPDLKVHRPETCYAVAGFSGARPVPIDTSMGSLTVPCVSFSARREDRLETVLYWTRVGDRFPQTLTSQRLDFLLEAAQGYRADGLLFRASTVAMEPKAALSALQEFSAALVRSSSAQGQRLLLGSKAA